jgi:two-component system response regulator CpxR
MTAALLIDDDARLGALVSEYLRQHDVEVTVAGDGEKGLEALGRRKFDLVLLDVMLPGADGFEVLKQIHGVPVIMLTARGEDVDKIVGLELGADDYLAKPFNPRELLARIRAVLRRAQAPAVDPKRFRTGELEIDFDAREVVMAGKRQVLTHFEFELLSVLARAAGRVQSREHLMDVLKGQVF